jgi:GT2 family glycosyltransferase
MLTRAVKSALDAMPTDSEVIVVDDGSEMPATKSLAEIKDRRLIVLRNDGRRGGGGSAARNLGLSRASGDVLFLLDDDDEILPDYCQFVLDTAMNTDNPPDYGFSAFEYVRNGQPPTIKCRDLPEGLVAQNTSFRATTFPFSIGVWMTRATYAEIGPIDDTLPTNSDTEYSCRLRAAGKHLWYTARPGVRIHEHSGQGDQLAQVTKLIPSASRAKAFQTIIERHSEYLVRDYSALRFLLKRHLTLAAKADLPPLDMRKVLGLSAVELFLMRGYYHSLRIALTAYGFRGSK